ncbi:MAG: helix-turn-helix domain-containing protein [Sphingomonadales bacterium]|nr:helix-turn-helix domain-containing protein [Sphingomonadales bacterium]MBD3772653.1 helix-turn-helix domain-containing protein [Paracoccaceae bacterium]
MTHPPSAVPFYRLYGEHSPGNMGIGLAELVHCETIASRSRLHDWEIAPHRHAALAQVLFLRSGSLVAMVGNAIYRSGGPVLVVAPPGVPHGFTFAPEAEGLVVTLSDELLSSLEEGDQLRDALATPGMVELPRGLADRLAGLGEELLIEAGNDRSAPRLRLTRSLADAWLWLALGDRIEQGRGGESGLQRRFRALVEAHYRNHRPLSFYAGELGCTERTLSRLTRDAWAMSPLEMIHARLALEAQRLLRFTNASCAEVAWELGFTDPSYFSRFFNRMTGQRPQQIKLSDTAGRDSAAG